MTRPSVWLARHGETEWSRDGLHTSTTELPLTDAGLAGAHALRDALAGQPFSLVLTSPRLRARHTAELAGYPDAEVDDDLVEWGYGAYEGLTTATIRESVPGWTVWSHPSPGGEAADEVGHRVDRVIERARASAGDVLLFGHSHCLRALDGPLARATGGGRTPLPPRHGDRLCARVRARDSGDPPLEHLSRNR